MTPLTDTRARWGGAALVAAPVVALGAALVHPRETTDLSRQVAITAGSLNRWYVAHLLYLVSFAVFVPAVLSLGRRLRESAPGLELWGTALAVVGLFSSAGLVALEGFGTWQLAQITDRAAAVDTVDRIVHSAGIAVPLGIVGLALPAGLVLVAIGLRRTDAAAWITPVLIAGAVLLAAGLAASVKPALIAGLAGIAAAMIACGLTELRPGGDPARGAAYGRSPAPVAR